MKRLDRVRKYADEGCTFRGGFLHETIRIAIVEAGQGFARHRKAAEILVREHRPKWVLCLGFSSSLSDNVKFGDLSVANEIVDTHGQKLEVHCRISSSRRIHVGRHVVADGHPLREREKAELASSSNAICVDTSSLAVAQVCQELSTKFMSIRSIVDSLAGDMPESAASLVFSPTSKAVGTAIGTLVKGLKQVSELNTWRKRANDSAENLDRFAAGIVLQIGDQLRD
ncbi:MAG: hypothetical protein R3C20_18920 [Planctomycetaceae bacterium]